MVPDKIKYYRSSSGSIIIKKVDGDLYWFNFIKYEWFSTKNNSMDVDNLMWKGSMFETDERDIENVIRERWEREQWNRIK